MQHDVVLKLFPHATTLSSYLKINKADDVFFQSKLTKFLHTTIIVSNQIANIPDYIASSKCSNDNVESRGHILMQDIISRLIAFIIRNFSTNRNVLSLGYRSKRWDSLSVLRNDNTTECHFVNTTHSYLLTSEWQQLADLLGEVAIRKILLSPVFMLLEEGNNCYVQVSGEPAQDMLYKLSQNNIECRKVPQDSSQSHKRKLVLKRSQQANVKKIKLPPKPTPQLAPSEITTSLNNICTNAVINNNTSTSSSHSSNLITLLPPPSPNNPSLNHNSTPMPITAPPPPPPAVTLSTPNNLKICHSTHLSNKNVTVPSTSPSTLPPTPPTLTTTAIFPSKVTGRTIIGRHRMLYVHKIWMPLHRIFKTNDTEALRKKMFPSTLHTIKDTLTIQSLNLFCDLIRKNELLCDVHHALHLTCLQNKVDSLDVVGVHKEKQCFDSTVVVNKNDTKGNNDLPVTSGIPLSIVKKTKRGCRSGRQVKARLSSMATRHKKLFNPNTGDISSKNTAIRTKYLLEDVATRTSARRGTVGNRLVARLLRSVRNERKLTCDHLGQQPPGCHAEVDVELLYQKEAEGGYITQEDDSSCCTFSTEATVVNRHESNSNNLNYPERLSRKKRTRKRYPSIHKDSVIEYSEANSGHALDVTFRNLLTKFSEDNSGNNGGMLYQQTELPIYNYENQPDDENSPTSNDTNMSCCTMSDSPININHNSEVDDEVDKENPVKRFPPPPPDTTTLSYDSIHRLACPRENVKAFMTAICRRLFPDHIVWGSRHNRSVFLAGVHYFIDLGRSSSLCLATVIKGLRTKEMPWLLGLWRLNAIDNCDDTFLAESNQQQSDITLNTVHKRKRKRKGGNEISHLIQQGDNTPGSGLPISNEAHRQSQQLLLEILHWIYEVVIIGLLGRVYYITEGEGSGTETLYFLRRDWKTVLELGKVKLSQQFLKVDLPGSGNNKGNQTSRAQDENRHLSKPINLNTNNEKLPAKSITTIMSTIPTVTSAFTMEMLTNKNVPTVRLLPKKLSVRPITNLGSRKRKRKDIPNGNNSNSGKLPSSNCPSAAASLSCDIKNSAMYNCLHLLRRVIDDRDKGNDGTTTTTTTLGFGVLGLNEVYQNFKQFRIRQSLRTLNTSMDRGHQEPIEVIKSNNILNVDEVKNVPYYVAAFDLEKCFDKINTAKLYNLVRDLLHKHHPSTASFQGGICRSGQRPYSGGSREEPDARFPKDRDIEDDNENDRYFIHRYALSHYIDSIDRPVVRTLRHVADTDDLVPFPEAAQCIAHTFKKCIITDAVVYPSISRKELLQLLKIHLFQHVVKMPFQDTLGEVSYYTQITGIPQGSVLSPLLCNLYYGNAENKLFDLGSNQQSTMSMENQQFEPMAVAVTLEKVQETTTSFTTIATSSSTTPIITTSPLTSMTLSSLPSFVIRLMDDYLVISENKESIIQFLQRIFVLLKMYGGGINPLKTRVSFEMEVEIEGERVSLPTITGKELAWCGMILNVHTLEVKPDWTRLLSVPLRWSYSIAATNKGQAFRRTIKYFFKSKCNPIFMDSGINNIQVVTSTVYRLYAITSLRTHCYVRDLHRSEGYIDMNFIATAIYDMIVFGARLIKSSNQYCLTPKKIDLQRHKSTSASSATIPSNCLRNMVRSIRLSNNCNRNSSRNVSDNKVTGKTSDCSIFNSTECELTYSQIVRLGLRACYKVLSQRAGYYRTVLQTLQLHLSRSQSDASPLSMSCSIFCKEKITQRSGNVSSGSKINNNCHDEMTTASEKYDLNDELFESCYDISDLLRLKNW